ncbi:MAG: cache domain-containing protein [Treponema sp.]|nr:cache domain-containing protein [Treponema sp.]
MPVSNKILISLIAAIILIALFMILAYTGFFDPAAAGFYNPSIIKTIRREIEQDTGAVQDFLWELQDRFYATLREPAVRRSFLPNQSAGDIQERSRLYGLLMDTQQGLQGVRFIDPGGARIHYSTYSQDMPGQNRGFASYRNYNSSGEEMPFEALAAPSGGEPRIIPDKKGRVLIFSLPFYDASDVYRGTALFSLAIGAVSERLASAGRIGSGEEAALLQSPAGVVLGLPNDGGERLLPAIASIWRLQFLNLTPLDPAETGTAPALISSRTAQGIYVGRLVEGAFIFFPPGMRIILVVSFFCTAYLTAFLIVNFRQDTMIIVQSRIKNLQAALIEEYHNHKGPADWSRWGQELEQRREAVRREIKRDIKGRRRKRLDAEIDACINNAWNELTAIIRSGTAPPVSGFSEARVEEIVKRVLRTAREDPGTGPGLTENSPHQETVTGTQVPQGKPPDASGRRIMAYTRKNAAKAEDAVKIRKLTSGKEGKAVEKDARYSANPVETGEVPEELEELEEIEELEGLEEPGKPVTEAQSSYPGKDISVLAREIEFTPLPEDETGSAGGPPLSDLEIVSPFGGMFSDLRTGEKEDSDAGISEKKDEPSGRIAKAPPAKVSKLEILDGNYQMSLVYRPFSLENVLPQDLAPAEPVIKSRNGVNYVNVAAVKGEKIPLDKDFKRLVDSVLG